jgi:membrane-bound metal-dependent hydrolase YbcI (DUF457 family)
MFIGHFAVALAAKRAAPEVSLGTLFVACELIDLVWPVLVLAGIEIVRIDPGNTAFTPLDFVHYPWTHSLLMCVAWAALLGGVYFLIKRNRPAALVVGLVVASHWLLDAVVHRPDLPLAPGASPLIGLGLWNSVGATLAVEAAMFAAGIALYLRATKARDAKGAVGFWAMIALLIIAYLGAAFGPPPPNVAAVAWAGILGGGLTAVLAYWVDRHRAAPA